MRFLSTSCVGACRWWWKAKGRSSKFCPNTTPNVGSWPLILISVIIVAADAWLTVSPLANTLGFVPPPPLYWLFLAIMLLAYAILTRVVKNWFIRRFGEGWRRQAESRILVHIRFAQSPGL